MSMCPQWWEIKERLGSFEFNNGIQTAAKVSKVGPPRASSSKRVEWPCFSSNINIQNNTIWTWNKVVHILPRISQADG
jgi:hypothetical protein